MKNWKLINVFKTMDKELRILMLEDVATDAELIEHELRSAKISFISKHVETREDFISELHNFAPDLILSDYRLPSLDGLEALAIAIKECPDVPFILVTGALGEDRAVEILKSGATDYVLKERLSRLPYVVLRALREAEERRERKRAEEALQEAEAKYRNIFENAVEGIFQSTPSGQFITVNPALARMLGYESPEEMIANYTDIEQQLYVEPGRRSEFKRLLEEHGIVWGFEYQVYRKDGSKIWISENVRAVRDASGQILYYKGMVEDITERKRAEEALCRRCDEIETSARILNAIRRTRDLDERLNLILDEIMMFLHVEFGTIHLLKDKELVLACWRGISDEFRSHVLSFPTEDLPVIMRVPCIIREKLGKQSFIPEFAGREGVQAWASIPLNVPPRAGQPSEWLGTIVLVSRRYEALSEDEIEILSAMVDQLAVAIDHARAYRQAQERLSRLQALREIDKAIMQRLELLEVLHVVLELVPKDLGADAAAISLLDKKQLQTKIFAMRLPNGILIDKEAFTIADSLLHWFVKQQKPVIIYDMTQDPRLQMHRKYMRNNRLISYLGVPLVVHDKTIGILHILTTKPKVFSDEDVEFFSTMAGQTAIAIENAQANEALRESEEKYRTVFENTGTATIIIEEDTIISLANTEFEKLSGYSREEIEGKKSATEFVVKDDLERLKEYHRLRRIDPNAAPRKYEFWFIDRHGNVKDILMSIDMIPQTKKSIASLLDITEHKQAEQKLQQSFEKLRKALGGTIQAMALTVEARDPYTAGHQHRVTNLARAIAKEMGLPDEQIDGIRMAGAIHDIGKITIPAEILSKPGQITELEFNIIKSHPRVGYDILKEIEFPWPIAQIVLQHHERMDGSGYPLGLLGEDILIEARILAIADVVEAMASHRPYRPAHGIDEALQEISQNRGILYDANVVDACLKLFLEKRFEFE